YDYWQNQPGNYRAPVLATSAVTRRSDKLLGGDGDDAPYAERASDGRTERAVGGVAWGPQEEDAARRFYHSGVRGGRLPSVAQVSGLAIGQSSTEPICWRSRQARTA
ncbi:hypothetical protein H9Q70_014666, partial [Fusarium xylarioides]